MTKEKESERVSLRVVPLSTENRFELPDGDIVDLDGYLLWLGNQVLTIKKAVA